MQRRVRNLAPIAAMLFAFTSGAHATVEHPLDPFEKGLAPRFSRRRSSCLCRPPVPRDPG